MPQFSASLIRSAMAFKSFRIRCMPLPTPPAGDGRLGGEVRRDRHRPAKAGIGIPDTQGCVLKVVPYAVSGARPHSWLHKR